MVDLEERVSQLESWTDGKGLVVQGAAGTFCSGSDLNAVRAISNPQATKHRNSLQYLSAAVNLSACISLPLSLGCVLA